MYLSSSKYFETIKLFNKIHWSFEKFISESYNLNFFQNPSIENRYNIDIIDTDIIFNVMISRHFPAFN
jgi:hypothetical protein